MIPGWRDEARRRLLASRRPGGAWGYGSTTRPAVEPTAIAGLALRESEPGAARSAASWIASAQAPDGSIGVTGAEGEPGWATPTACLLWSAIGGFDDRRAAALAWLVGARGLPLAKGRDDPMGHDTTLVGWAWVDGTHSWVEPTATALLAVGGRGPRSVEGLALIRDRAIPTGGWNLGNPVVFGTILRPLPAPTGLALLALAKLGGPTEPTVGPALRYLRSALRATLAPASLAWGRLGLAAWGVEDSEIDDRLGASYARLTRRAPGPMDLAMLLLASDDGSIPSLGLVARSSEARHA